MMIDTKELIDFSKRAAKIHLDLQEKALKEKQATEHQFSAISFFMQKYDLYEYIIPGLIKNFEEEKNEGNI